MFNNCGGGGNTHSCNHEDFKIKIKMCSTESNLKHNYIEMIIKIHRSMKRVKNCVNHLKGEEHSGDSVIHIRSMITRFYFLMKVSASEKSPEVESTTLKTKCCNSEAVRKRIK